MMRANESRRLMPSSPPGPVRARKPMPATTVGITNGIVNAERSRRRPAKDQRAKTVGAGRPASSVRKVERSACPNVKPATRQYHGSLTMVPSPSGELKLRTRMTPSGHTRKTPRKAAAAAPASAAGNVLVVMVAAVLEGEQVDEQVGERHRKQVGVDAVKHPALAGQETAGILHARPPFQHAFKQVACLAGRPDGQGKEQQLHRVDAEIEQRAGHPVEATNEHEGEQHAAQGTLHGFAGADFRSELVAPEQGTDRVRPDV